MKYVKIIFGILVVAVTTCCISVFATQKWYSITLKAFNAATTLGPQSKETTVAQGYKNIGTINTCTSNNNSVSVRVYSESEGNSSWITVSNGATSYWPENNKTTKVQAYNLEIKNGTVTPCTASHGGAWYLDNH